MNWLINAVFCKISAPLFIRRSKYCVFFLSHTVPTQWPMERPKYYYFGIALSFWSGINAYDHENTMKFDCPMQTKKGKFWRVSIDLN